MSELLDVLGLSEWTVTLRTKRCASDDCGTAHVRVPYREATITIYPKAIAETKQTFPNESAYSVLRHELCEVLMASHEGMLPGEILANPQFIAYQDACADHIARVLERMGV